MASVAAGVLRSDLRCPVLRITWRYAPSRLARPWGSSDVLQGARRPCGAHVPRGARRRTPSWPEFSTTAGASLTHLPLPLGVAPSTRAGEGARGRRLLFASWWQDQHDRRAGAKPWSRYCRSPPYRILCPRQDSNLRHRLRRAVLYPLSYGGSGRFRGYQPLDRAQFANLAAGIDGR